MLETQQQTIQAFKDGHRFAVVGASTNRDKYGNKVVRCYQQAGKAVVPVNPRADVIEGEPCVASLSDVPGIRLSARATDAELPGAGARVDGVSIITPPKITAQVIDEAIALGVKRIWIQPGAEHDEAIEKARQAGVSVIAHGPCLLVVLGFRESF